MGNNLSKVQLTVEQIIDKHLQLGVDMLGIDSSSKIHRAKFNSLITKNPFLEKTLLQLKKQDIEKQLRQIGVISKTQ